MIRLSRITDYGIVLMAHLAACPEGAPHNARELAAETRLPLPVVSKVLKALARARAAGLAARRQGRLRARATRRTASRCPR